VGRQRLPRRCDVAALQAAADKLSPAIIRERLDYWTFILGPKFSDKERKKINSIRSRRSNTAATSSSRGTSPSTGSSSSAVSWGCGG
jgi:hypothetical protein